MKIESIRIENFRSFDDETITIDNYTCFVGPNGSGKSTVLCAFNVFFRQYKDSKTDLSKLSVDDFHHKDTSRPIRITVTFFDLSEEAKVALSNYVRLNKLVVTAEATFDKNSNRAEVKQFGNRLAFVEFSPYFLADKNGASAAELKDIYSKLREAFPDIPNAKSKGDMESALRVFESSRPDSCELLPSEDQFYGVSRGVNRLSPHIQWVFLPAIKDASEESEESKTSALGQLLARTVRSRVDFSERIRQLGEVARQQYKNILDAEQAALDELSEALDGRLKSWAHPNTNARVNWKLDSESSVKGEEPFAQIRLGERGFEGDLHRFGHGLQRSYILALLHELSQVPGESSLPTLVLGIEEPELFQHPPQARHLANVLQAMAEGNNQVLVCTHSPLFINGSYFEQVRMVRGMGIPAVSKVAYMPYEELARQTAAEGKIQITKEGMMAKVHQALTPFLNELFFCNVLILVEGLEDVAHLNTYIILMEEMDRFRGCGCHIVPVGGKSEISRPLAIAKHLGIPVFLMFDADSDKPTENGELEKHRKDNELILKICGYEKFAPLPAIDFHREDLTMWSKNLTVVVEREIQEWKRYEDEAAAYLGNPGGLKKNSVAIGYALERAWAANKKSPSLIGLIDSILSFAAKT